MSNDLALIMPAAGRGSRFTRSGILEPKPLIDLEGRPFFWWATESVRRTVKLRQIIYVILEEHIVEFALDQRIKTYYPDATILSIPDITSGAAETARLGLEALLTPGPVAINDCDHAFICHSLPCTVSDLQDELEAALMCFRSSDPAYSYIKLDQNQHIVGTVEKAVVSPFAIAGCYFFSDPRRYIELYERYVKECPYNELFISGIFNLVAEEHLKIGKLEAQHHVSFGTPEERSKIQAQAFAPFLAWK
jgi:dTDP-glucose pyrophosphorylase